MLSGDIYRKIGLKISYYRKLKNLEQKELAYNVGISAQYLSRIECGQKIPSIPVLVRIAEKLGIDIALLISDKD